MFPNRGSQTGRSPFLIRVPAVRFPRFIGTMRALRLLTSPSRSLRFLRSRYHPLIAFFVPRIFPSPRHSQSPRRAGSPLYTAFPLWRFPHRWSNMSSPRFLGNPSCTFALLLDPGGCRMSGSTTPRCCPRYSYHEGSRYSSFFFEARSHGFCTRCLRFALWSP